MADGLLIPQNSNNSNGAQFITDNLSGPTISGSGISMGSSDNHYKLVGSRQIINVSISDTDVRLLHLIKANYKLTISGEFWSTNYTNSADFRFGVGINGSNESYNSYIGEEVYSPTVSSDGTHLTLTNHVVQGTRIITQYSNTEENITDFVITLQIHTGGRRYCSNVTAKLEYDLNYTFLSL